MDIFTKEIAVGKPKLESQYPTEEWNENLVILKFEKVKYKFKEYLHE